MEEALGGIIAFILTLIHYALQTVLDIAALGITQIIGGLHRHTPLYYQKVSNLEPLVEAGIIRTLCSLYAFTLINLAFIYPL